ncbi:helix-turn-helix transcriptional regulator [Caballeronia sp. ATUFL_M2_KS44]|uniref:helix-turn-helix transcriptional regulator n=1 Tax=Caballeronia sp. ATUFL_M2_KS44 TaxID=2921767 RepID=UPI00202801A8|nr:helix-turn-helix transcriptional regulator [Caballeronia sp. ATUFL_M2_KS44]
MTSAVAERHGPLDDMINAIGTAAFPERFAWGLREMCGAEFAFIFRLFETRPVEFASVDCEGTHRVEHIRDVYLGNRCWEVDDGISALDAENATCFPMLKTDIKLSTSGRLRQTLYDQLNIRDRVLMCTQFEGDPLVLSITRSEQHGPFEKRQVDNLAVHSATILSIVAKHCDIAMRARRLPGLLTELPAIEQRVLAAAYSLTAREVQVCARYLYGVSTCGIASDLGIGTETVNTYRKRLYERLAIGSHRELLLWYLGLCGQLQ